MCIVEEYPEKSHILKMRDGDSRCVDYIIEKGNWYYGESNLVYWEGGSSFGFIFDNSIKQPTETKQPEQSQ